jgi:hypothetical protein
MVKKLKYTEIFPVVSHFSRYKSWQQFSAMGEEEVFAFA